MKGWMLKSGMWDGDGEGEESGSWVNVDGEGGD